MSKQVHFVIAVDVDTKEIYIDDDTYSARFDEEQGYFDTDTESWKADDDQSFYNQALKILNTKAQLGKE
jgi:hypothetical protein